MPKKRERNVVVFYFEKDSYGWAVRTLSRKIWCIFVLAILKTNPFSNHLYKCNFIQNLDFERILEYL